MPAYSLPLTHAALSPGPAPRAGLPATHCDLGGSPRELQANALHMATHPAVRAGLVSTPEAAREFDEAAVRLSRLPGGRSDVETPMQTLIRVVAPRMTADALDGLAVRLSAYEPVLAYQLGREGSSLCGRSLLLDYTDPEVIEAIVDGGGRVELSCGYRRADEIAPESSLATLVGTPWSESSPW